MKCPRCYQENTTNLGTHYVCNNPLCHNEDGSKTQFLFINDTKKEAPYNQIYQRQSLSKFYKKPYLLITEEGNMSLGR